MASDRTQRNIRRAAELIAKADALLITAGAGMGVGEHSRIWQRDSMSRCTVRTPAH